MDEYLDELSARELEKMYEDQKETGHINDLMLNIPSELQKIKQWMLWKAELRPNGKINKPPVNKDGYKIDCTSPNNWLSFDEAMKIWLENQDKISGVGFVFTKDLGLVGVDFDGVIINGVLLPEFETWTKIFGSYTETSISGKGLHIICKGTLPGKGNRKGNVEMYEDKRFFVFSGNEIGKSDAFQSKIKEAQEAINALYSAKLIEQENKPQREEKESVKPLLSPVFYAPLVEDEKIIQVATRAKNGQKFLSLMDGNISGYTSQSDADLALCSILAFYTQDIAQIERIFSFSGLCREKWNRLDYRKSTIEKAMNNTFSKFDWSKTMENLDQKLSKKMIKLEEKKDKELLFSNVLEMTEKAYKITVDGGQIGLSGLVSVWIPKSEIKDYLEEKSSFVIPDWLFGKLAEKAKAI
jgi:primase-polymerase (primpol)-like protein